MGMRLGNGPSGLQLQESTGLAGFALINGTPTIISWSVPNDGQMHRYEIFMIIKVASSETGGQVNLNFTAPDGTPQSIEAFAGGLPGPGIHFPVNSNGTGAVVVAPGTIVSITEQTALTAGAAVLYAEIWGS